MIALHRSPWTEVRAHLASGRTVAVLPFGALEQHGPHLPLSTDTLQAESLATRIATDIGALLLPAVPYGQTWDNAGFPGTVSLSAATTSAICVDIGKAVHGFGVTTLVVVNGDYGNRKPLHDAAAILTAEGADTVVLDYPGLLEIGDDVKETPWAAPGLCHADEIETSMILAVDPGLVRADEMVECYPEMPSDFGTRPIRFDTLSESGVFGNPFPATAEKGERILSEVAARSVEAVKAHLNEIGSSAVTMPGRRG